MMDENGFEALTIYQKLTEAVEVIRRQFTTRPQIGLILGSGLGEVASSIQNAKIIPYSHIPHFHGTSIEGHAGQMILGDYEGVSVVILQGRFHYYEGYAMHEIVFPTQVACALGIQTLILTNASGGVNTRYRPTDIMLIEDHINLMGDNPLKGKQIAELGPRFPDLTEPYSLKCLKILEDTAKELHIRVQRGTYAAMVGPTYETPAEVRMLRTMGVDAVGMSTVPECLAATHLGVQVIGISCIANLASGMTAEALSHKQVIRNAGVGAIQIHKLLKRAVPRLVQKKEVNSLVAKDIS
jgi:purine-nucleoside phosphorylase